MLNGSADERLADDGKAVSLERARLERNSLRARHGWQGNKLY